MRKILKLSDLYDLSPEEKNKKIQEFCNSPPSKRSDESISHIKQVLAEYEVRYKMSSQEMLDKLNSNSLQITTEIDEWLFWFHLYSRVNSQEG